jgi:membrane protein implicated in regulation of membrane protease activity
MTQPATPTGPLGKALAVVFGTILLVLGFMFSLVLFAVIAVVGLAAFGYFWWKTRALRKAMREQAPRTESGGQVIEGEAVIVEEYEASQRPTLPPDADKPK